MPVTVVVGGQFGSEGKGKVAYYFTKMKKARLAVRVGGVNSGHTVIDSHGNPVIFKHLPTASILPDVVCVLPSGSYIDINILRAEIKSTGLNSDRLVIDPNAVIISDDDREKEREYLKNAIGSTGSGTGAAVQRRISRTHEVRFAEDEPLLKSYICLTIPYMKEKLQQGQRIIIEGTQGYGLSLLHSDHYPYVTSRDTTAAGFVSETGLSPLDVDEVILTIRAYPIRVGGNSGPLPDEIDWETVTQESGSPEHIIEYTSVTKKVRRVARFHPDVVKKAIAVNKPSSIVLNHLDYIDAKCRIDDSPTEKTCDFIREIESQLGISIGYYGFGPASLLQKKELVNV